MIGIQFNLANDPENPGSSINNAFAAITGIQMNPGSPGNGTVTFAIYRSQAAAVAGGMPLPNTNQQGMFGAMSVRVPVTPNGSDKSIPAATVVADGATRAAICAAALAAASAAFPGGTVTT
jgi:hypothetical protein